MKLVKWPTDVASGRPLLRESSGSTFGAIYWQRMEATITVDGESCGGCVVCFLILIFFVPLLFVLGTYALRSYSMKKESHEERRVDDASETVRQVGKTDTQS